MAGSDDDEKNCIDSSLELSKYHRLVASLLCYISFDFLLRCFLMFSWGLKYIVIYLVSYLFEAHCCFLKVCFSLHS